MTQRDNAPAKLTMAPPPRPKSSLTALLMLTALAFAAFWLGVRLHAPRLLTPRPILGPVVTARFFEMGQGCSLLLISPEGRAVLIDAGTTLTEESALKIEMRRANVGALSAVIITSCRVTAIGGLPRLLSSVAVRGPILIPVPLDRFVAQGGRAAELCMDEIKHRGLSISPSRDYLDEHPGLLGEDTSLTSRVIAGDPADADVVRFQDGRATLVYLGNLTQAEEESALALRGHLACDTLVTPAGDDGSAITHEMLALSSAETIVVPLPLGHTPSSQTLSILAASDARVLLMSQPQPVALGLSAQSDTVQVFNAKMLTAN